MRHLVAACFLACATATPRPPAVTLTTRLDTCRFTDHDLAERYRLRMQDTASRLWELDGPKDSLTYEGYELGTEPADCPIDLAFKFYVFPDPATGSLEGHFSAVANWRCVTMYCATNYDARIR